MRGKVNGYIVAFLFLFLLLVPNLYGKSTPTLNNGKKWRIGYYEGGAYSEYTDTMRTLVSGLIELGWITDKKPPDIHEEISKPYVDWLISSNSPYLSFTSKDCYSANWDNELRKQIRKELIQKLKKGELDLVIAMGTWAGIDLANNKHSVPIMILSTSDPVRAGIIKSVENSGFEHVTARVDPKRYLRQIRMFHRVVGFDTLGIAFENTPDGRIYSAISEAQQIAKERNFEIITCEVLDTIPDTQESDRSCLKCFRELSEKADAVYVTALTCTDRKTKEIADIFKGANVPSFSLVGSKWVKSGMLLSISSDSGYSELGRYNAKKFGAILNGARPGSLKQLFSDPLDIAINIRTAEEIGFAIPSTILKIAEEVYVE